MISEDKANKFLESILSPYAASIGFTYNANGRDKYNPPSLSRSTPSGYEKIGDLYIEFFNKKFYMTGGFGKRLDPIEKIWSNYYSDLNPTGSHFDPKALMTIVSNAKLIEEYSYDPKNKFKWLRTNDRYETESTENGIQDLSKKFITTIENTILPTFQKYDSVQSIDRTMNEVPETYFECIHIFSANGLMFKKMIVAKLSNNTNYESISSIMRQKITQMDESEESIQKHLVIWEKIRSDLK